MADEDRPPAPEPDIPPHLQADIDYSKYDSEELDPPDWITNLDREILALLGNTGVIMTPAVIAKNIDRSRTSVSRRLSTLEAGNMIEKVDRGNYRISDEGHARMIEKVPAEGPPESDDEQDWVAYRILTPEEVDEVEEEGKLGWGE